MDEISIQIDGKTYYGWTDVVVQRSLMNLSGAFKIALADTGEGQNWSFATQKSCILRIGNDKLITGVIDSVEFSVDAESHTVILSGRDRTADLIDCSVVADNTAKPHPGTILNSDIYSIALELIKPFSGQAVLTGSGVSVGERFARFAIQRGETVFEALDRAAKQRGLILTTDEDGKLVLTLSGDTRATDNLKYGKNVKVASGRYDYSNRFSHYRIEAQSSGDGSTSKWNKSVNVFGTKMDASVQRFRPIIMNAEAESTLNSCKKRATLEALYRAANSITFQVVVVGWRQADKSLWKLNQLVSVDIPALFLKEELLIANISYTRSNEDGSLTEFTLMRKDAFNQARALEAQAIKDQAGAPTTRFKVVNP